MINADSAAAGTPARQTKRALKRKQTAVECIDCGEPCDGTNDTPDGPQCDECAEDGGVWTIGETYTRWTRLR